MSDRDGELALRVSRLSKVYRLYEKPIDRLKELLLRRPRHTDFTALTDVSFALARGKTLGVIGDNGAGKSTLLQLIAGTLTPTDGRIERYGSVQGLLELGVGFHIDFSGRQNIFLYGDVLGLPHRMVQSKLDEIIAFSELEEFIDRPLKIYSTGMRMRLAFALVSSLDPDILLVDEALSVGDGYFQKKCIDRMMDIKAQGCTILFCSHGTYRMGVFCDEVLWLKEGAVRMLGETTEVLSAYDAYQLKRNEEAEVVVSGGDAPVRIVALEVLNELPVKRGDDLRVLIRTESVSDELLYHVALSIKLGDGYGVYATGTHLSGKPPIHGRHREIIIAYPKIPLLGGVYSVQARVFDDEGLVTYHTSQLSEIHVYKDSEERGICYLENHWEFS